MKGENSTELTCILEEDEWREHETEPKSLLLKAHQTATRTPVIYISDSHVQRRVFDTVKTKGFEELLNTMAAAAEKCKLKQLYQTHLLQMYSCNSVKVGCTSMSPERVNKQKNRASSQVLEMEETEYDCPQITNSDVKHMELLVHSNLCYLDLRVKKSSCKMGEFFISSDIKGMETVPIIHQGEISNSKL